MPYLQCYDISKEFQLRKINLNHGGKPAAAGTSLEDQHVSFTVMDMALSPNGKYLALATDASRNMVVDIESGLHIRNLYGHQNDGYSNPKLAWSSNGQYILGNTQADASLCVWDIASSQLVQRYGDAHGQTIRDMCASTTTDILVTTSFDKKTLLWFGPSK
jgi:WD40 repeat protein